MAQEALLGIHSTDQNSNRIKNKNDSSNFLMERSKNDRPLAFIILSASFILSCFLLGCGGGGAEEVAAPGSLVVAPTSGLITTESGGTAQFVVLLSHAPRSLVMVSVESLDLSEGRLDTALVTFSESNWNVPQVVTVTGVDDQEADGRQDYAVRVGPTSSADARFDALAPVLVTVANVDDGAGGKPDTPAETHRLVLSKTLLTTSESGGHDTVAVSLSARPAAEVIVPVMSTNPAEGVASPASLTLTPDDWESPQTVSILGVNDNVADGGVYYQIKFGPVISSDSKYNGVEAVVTALNEDDDEAAIIVSMTSALLTQDEMPSHSFTVNLSSAPLADVTVNLALRPVDLGTLSKNSLTFTSADWMTPQSATLAGRFADQLTGEVEFTSMSHDPTYQGLTNGIVVLNCGRAMHDGGGGACATHGNCSLGHHNDGTGHCMLGSDAKDGCASLYHDGGDGVCVARRTCSSGYHDNGTGTCILGNDAASGCMDGYHNDGMGKCIVGDDASAGCAEGYHDGGDGHCTVSGSCSLGYVSRHVAYFGEYCVSQKSIDSGVDYKIIPAGSFTSSGFYGPVQVAAFKLAKTPTTVAQFKTCVEAGVCLAPNYQSYSPSDPKIVCNYDRGEAWLNHPMNCVDWAGARKFCEWIGGRLPTEDEWQYAAIRNETEALQMNYPWGNTAPAHCGHANYRGSSSPNYYCDGTIEVSFLVGTSAVGTYSPRGDTLLGLQDMAGNVWEWASSLYSSESTHYTVKGGSWSSDAFDLTVSSRYGWDPSDRSDVGGFRCAE